VLVDRPHLEQEVGLAIGAVVVAQDRPVAVQPLALKGFGRGSLRYVGVDQQQRLQPALTESQAVETEQHRPAAPPCVHHSAGEGRVLVAQESRAPGKNVLQALAVV